MAGDMIRNIVMQSLEEMGVMISKDINNNENHMTLLPEDIDLRDYVIDSLMFISFVVDLEEKFDLEFPDELLTMDSIASLSGFCNLLSEIINSRKEVAEK